MINTTRNLRLMAKFLSPMAWLALLATCTQTHEPQRYGKAITQVSLARVDQMPDLPQPYAMKDWHQTARDLYPYLLDFNATGPYQPFVWRDTMRRNFDQETFGIYTAIGDVRQGLLQRNSEGHEALCVLGVLFCGTLAGYDFSDYQGRNLVRMSRNYFNTDNGWNIVMNFTSPAGHIGGGYGNDWWYDLFNNMLFYAVGAQYPEDTTLTPLLRTIAEQYYKADSLLGDNYSHSYFDFAEMQGKTNHIVPQEDAAAGFAWLLYAAYQRFGDEKYLRGAQHALEVLLSQKESRFYEVLMPFGAYVAARLNAEHGTDYDVQKILDWTFDGTATNREGWGVIAERWGGYDMHGIVGSTIHNGGYGFLMNGFDMAWPLVPMVRYDPRYAATISKWMLNVANASRLFYPNDLPDSLQAIPQHKEVTKNLIAYEGLIKESTYGAWKGITPFAQGDGPNWAPGNPPESMFSIYGSAHVGIFGSIIQKTNVEGILQLNCLATDLFRSGAAWPTYLYYNPHPQGQHVEIAIDGQHDLYDLISKTLVATNAVPNTPVFIAAQSALLLVAIPAGTPLIVRENKLYADEVVVDWKLE